MRLIINSSIHDIPEIAICHKSAFKNSFSSLLGSLYVQKMLSWYLIDEKARLYHVKDDESKKVLGYLAYVVNDSEIKGSSTSMLNFTKKELIKALIRKPWLIILKIDYAKLYFVVRKIGIRLKFIKPRNPIPFDFKPSLGLVIIGVRKEYQCKGIGSFLLKEFERIAVQDYGIKKLNLSVLTNNQQAISSYKKNGWQLGDIKGKSLSMFKCL